MLTGLSRVANGTPGEGRRPRAGSVCQRGWGGGLVVVMSELTERKGLRTRHVASPVPRQCGVRSDAVRCFLAPLMPVGERCTACYQLARRKLVPGRTRSKAASLLARVR